MSTETQAPPMLREREPGEGLRTLKDNLEAFAVAIVMALVIKHFCVEAFKIPTNSMFPTLVGSDKDGDRILVDKLAYLTSGPARWDVIVFRYPLDKSRNFIKRVAGLPGERLRIVSGDLWVQGPDDSRFSIATKPERQRNELYFSVYPATFGFTSPQEERGWLDRTWTSETPDAWRVEDPGRFEFAGTVDASLDYVPKVRSETHASNRGEYAGGGVIAHDVRIRARVTARAPGSVSFSWRVDGRVCEVRLSTPGRESPSGVAVRSDDGTREEGPLDAALAVDRPTDVVFECVDGEVLLRVDGRSYPPLSQNRRIEEAPDDAQESQTQRLSIRAEGGASTVEGFRIDRDLWYEDDNMASLAGPEGLRVEDHSYFMLGDNTKGSSDSRKWTKSCLVLKDGRRICWDGTGSSSSSSPSDWRSGDETRPPSAFLRRQGTIRHVVDVEGIERWWMAEDEDGERSPPRESVPFVHRNLVVGRAFFVFWPLVPGFPGRLKLIH